MSIFSFDVRFHVYKTYAYMFETTKQNKRKCFNKKKKKRTTQQPEIKREKLINRMSIVVVVVDF